MNGQLRKNKKHRMLKDEIPVLAMKRRIRRIVREFSQETGIPIIFEKDQIIAERSQKRISLIELEHALSHIQAELLEDALPIVLFHLDEEAVYEQAKAYLRGANSRVIEKVALTYKIQPAEAKTKNPGEESLPLRYNVGRLEWQLGVQCGNSIRERLLISSHSFIPINKIVTTVDEKRLLSLFEESADKWPIQAVAGPLSEAANLFYLSGSRISDFLFEQSFVEGIQTAVEMRNEELVFFPISRHFALFTNERDTKTISKIAKKGMKIAEMATQDNALAEILGITKEELNPVGMLGQAVFHSDRLHLGVSPIARISWDITGGEALIGSNKEF